MAKTMGLALGGGGARGWAHIGVIRALEEADIQIDYLAGTSIGALVGAVYLADALDRLEAFADEITLEKIIPLVDVSFPGPGLIGGDRIREFIADYVADRQIEAAAIPFQCVATDFLLKHEVALGTGPMVDAVRASISIPGIFTPFQRNKDVYLVDGGVVNPVPVSVVKEMGAEVIIAVNLNKDPKTERSPGRDQTAYSRDARSESSSTPEFVANLANRYDALKTVLKDQVNDWIPDPTAGLNIFDVLGNSINVMEQRVTEANLLIDKPDVLIEPKLIEFGIFDFHQAKPMIQLGYDAAQASLPKIEAAIASVQ